MQCHTKLESPFRSSAGINGDRDHSLNTATHLEVNPRCLWREEVGWTSLDFPKITGVKGNGSDSMPVCWCRCISRHDITVASGSRSSKVTLDGGRFQSISNAIQTLLCILLNNVSLKIIVKDKINVTFKFATHKYTITDQPCVKLIRGHLRSLTYDDLGWPIFCLRLGIGKFWMYKLLLMITSHFGDTLLRGSKDLHSWQLELAHSSVFDMPSEEVTAWLRP